VPFIILNGAEWFASLGVEKNTGPKLYCLSGHVKRPGVYEATMKTTLRELIYDFAGGIRDGRELKAVIPGGSSTPVMLASQIDVAASFDGIAQAGSMLGSAAIMVMDDSTCMVWLAENLLHFYKHESCGKCTPCREGTYWMYKLIRRVERGEGRMEDIDLITSVAHNINGKTLCPFGDAAVAPAATVKHFRHERGARAQGGVPSPADWRARHTSGTRRLGSVVA
jgi:NADH-quinone oxidoreductase subunit F